MEDLNDYLNQPVDLESLLSGLDFQDTEVATAAMAGPKLYAMACRLRIQKMRRRNRAEANLSLCESAQALKVRKKFEKTGDKLTEGYLKDLVRSTPEYQKAARLMARAEEEEEAAKLLVRAYEMRRDACKVVSDMNRSEGIYAQAYLNQGGVGMSMADIRRRLKEKYPGATS